MLPYNDPWYDNGPNGELVVRQPTWRERLRRFRVSGDYVGIILLLAIIAVIVSSVKYANHKDAKTAAAVTETRMSVLADLHEDGIPAFTGDYRLELITFTDSLHPSNATFQDFEIMGIQATDKATIYYLVDMDGYASTLTLPSNGVPIWRPSYQPSSAESETNPTYRNAISHYLDGDFSVHFTSIDSENSN